MPRAAVSLRYWRIASMSARMWICMVSRQGTGLARKGALKKSASIVKRVSSRPSRVSWRLRASA